MVRGENPVTVRTLFLLFIDYPVFSTGVESVNTLGILFGPVFTVDINCREVIFTVFNSLTIFFTVFDSFPAYTFYTFDIFPAAFTVRGLTLVVRRHLGFTIHTTGYPW